MTTETTAAKSDQTYQGMAVNAPGAGACGDVWATETTWGPKSKLTQAEPKIEKLIDGADAARFLRWVAEALEQAALLLFA